MIERVADTLLALEVLGIEKRLVELEQAPITTNYSKRSGGVTSITGGTGSAILANGVSGVPQTGAVTIELPVLSYEPTVGGTWSPTDVGTFDSYGRKNGSNSYSGISTQALTSTNLTATRVVFAGTGGLLADAAGMTYTAATNLFNLLKPGIATTSTPSLNIENATAATAGVPVQYSPREDYIGHVWTTALGGADRTMRFGEELQGTSAATPTATLVWKSSVDTGTASFTNRMTLDSAGQLAVPTTGSGAGLLLGADAQWFRGATNRMDLASGDSLYVVSGQVGVGVTPSTTVGLDSRMTDSANAGLVSLQGWTTITGSISATFPKGFSGRVTLNSGSNTLSYVAGGFFSVRDTDGMTGTQTEIYGGDYDVWLSGQENVGTWVGQRTFMTLRGTRTAVVTTANLYRAVFDTQSGSAGSVTTLDFFTTATSHVGATTIGTVNFYKANWSSTTAGAGAITTLNNFYISNPDADQTITNLYGLYIEGLTRGGTLNVGIYFAGTAGTIADGIRFNDVDFYRSAANTLAFAAGDGLTFSTTGFLQIPAAAGGATVDAAGEICVDSTSRTLNFYDGTAEVVLNPERSHSFTILSPAATTDHPLIRMKVAGTLTRIDYLCIGGTNWVGQIQEGDANGGTGVDVHAADITATAGTTNSSTSFSNAAYDANDWLLIKTTSISGTPTSISITLWYRESP